MIDFIVYDASNGLNLFFPEYLSLIDETDSEGKTPLHHAANTCQFSCILLLKKFGANIHLKDSEGNVPKDLVLEVKTEAMKKREILMSSNPVETHALWEVNYTISRATRCLDLLNEQ